MYIKVSMAGVSSQSWVFGPRYSRGVLVKIDKISPVRAALSGLAMPGGQPGWNPEAPERQRFAAAPRSRPYDARS